MVSLRLLTRSRETIAYIRNIFNDTLQREINSLSSFTFSITSDNVAARLIKEELLIEFQREYFLVKHITDEIDSNGESIKTVTAESQAIELMYDILPVFQLVNRTAEEAISEALKGNRGGWTVGTVEIQTVRSMDREDYANRYQLLTKIRELYGGEIEYDTENKKVNLREKIGKNEGVMIAYNHNASLIRRISDAYDFGTRLYALGYDNITTASVNGTGQDYLEADTVNQYGIVDLPWKTQIKDPATLYELAQLKLELVKHPRRSYIVDAAVIGSSVSLGDAVRVKDGDQWVSTRVVGIQEYPTEPWRNKITIDSEPLGYRSMQERLASLMQTVESNRDIWDKARLLGDGTIVEYGKRDYEQVTTFILSQAYYSPPTVWLGLQKEDPQAADPIESITLIADYQTTLDANNNKLYTGIIAKVATGPTSLPGFKITMTAYCLDPV